MLTQENDVEVYALAARGWRVLGFDAFGPLVEHLAE